MKYYILIFLAFLMVSNLVGQSTFQRKLKIEDQILTIMAIAGVDDAFFGIARTKNWWVEHDPINTGTYLFAMDKRGEVLWSLKYQVGTYTFLQGGLYATKDGNLIAVLQAVPLSDESSIVEVILLKFTPKGEVLWDFKAEVANRNPLYLTDFAETTSQEYVFSTGGVLVKMDEEGQLIWQRMIGFANDYINYQLIALADGSTISLGRRRSTDFLGNGNTFMNTIMCKVSPEGTVLWTKVMDGIRPTSIDYLPDGRVLVMGFAIADQFQQKLFYFDEDGNLIEGKKFPLRNQTVLRHTKVLEDGGLIAYFYGRDANYLTKLTSTGQIEWSREYPQSFAFTGDIFEVSTTIAPLKDGSFVILNKKDYVNSSRGEDTLIKTDVFGNIEHCYHTNICIETLSYESPTIIEIEVLSREARTSELVDLVPLEGRFTPFQLQIQAFCTEINSPSPYFAIPDTLCQSGIFPVDSLRQAAANSWRWIVAGEIVNIGAEPQEMNFTRIGEHQITHIISTEGCLDTFSRSIQVVAPSPFEIGVDTTICEDTSFEWNITQGKLQNYTWSDGQVGPTRTISVGETYTAFAQDAYCDLSDTRKIQFIKELYANNPFALDLDTTICQQRPLLIDVAHPAASDYRWSDGIRSSTRTIYKTGTYVATATIANCPFQIMFQVDVEDCAPKLYLPNAFSPNNDGVNDELQIGTKYAHIILLQVFDRWGNLIYEGIDDWDGKINGILAATGAYHYLVQYEAIRLGGIEQSSGTITLIR